MKKLIIILVAGIFVFSCQKSNNFPRFDNMDVTSGFVIDNAIILSEGNCAGDAGTHTYICFISVLNDSRCPDGAECIWAGNAQAKFKFVKAESDPVFFNLNTNTGFTNDTIIGDYRFTLKALNPYPSIKNIVIPKPYKAEIEIDKVAR